MLAILSFTLLFACGGSSAGDTSGSDGGSAARHHPQDQALPEVHGADAKQHAETCTDCHGADLTGDGDAASCDDCHADGWRTDCTWCHGGADGDTTGAPPQDLDDGDADAAFGEHAQHVSQGNHGAYACSQCHTTPTDVLAAGHLFDATPGQAETTFDQGLSPQASWEASARSCSDLYCHGNGVEHDGSVTVGSGPLGCDSCHVEVGLGGHHSVHLLSRLGCDQCHAETVDSDDVILAPEQHVDGDVDVALSFWDMAWDGATKTCDGTCHGEPHDQVGW